MTLTAREKLAFDIGTMLMAHWNNFHDFNYNPTLKSYLDKIKPDVPTEEVIAMNNELKNYLEDVDYKLNKGMQEMIDEDRAKGQ